MKVFCKYNPSRDLKKVDQTGYVDLTAANAESTIPTGIPLSEARYNGIEDPNSIGFRPGDQFEAVQASKVIAGYKAPENTPTAE